MNGHPKLTLEQALELAYKIILPPGYKPEDYLAVNETIPLKIARLVIKEALHILEMANR